jgi:uncharacterized phage protein (TIGR02220 family)
LTEEKAMEILESCAELKAIDQELFSKGIIWSDNFVENLEHLYKKRTLNAPDKPDKDNINSVSSTRNPHSIVKDSKVENSIDSLIPQIIEDLNHVTGKAFRPTTASTIKLLNGRIAEGYTLDDFKRVHRLKFAEWGSDPSMEQYLRPGTLYRPGNFESYANKRTIEEIEEAEKATAASRELMERIDKVQEFIRETEEKLKGIPEDHPEYERHSKAIGRAKSELDRLQGKLKEVTG